MDTVVAALAASISTGRALGKTAVKRAAVLYIAAEDPNGILERAYGFFQNHAADIADFEVFGWPIDLSDDKVMAQFAAEAAQFARTRQAERLLIVFVAQRWCGLARCFGAVCCSLFRQAQPNGGTMKVCGDLLC